MRKETMIKPSVVQSVNACSRIPRQMNDFKLSARKELSQEGQTICINRCLQEQGFLSDLVHRRNGARSDDNKGRLLKTEVRMRRSLWRRRERKGYLQLLFWKVIVMRIHTIPIGR